MDYVHASGEVTSSAGRGDELTLANWFGNSNTSDLTACPIHAVIDALRLSPRGKSTLLARKEISAVLTQILAKLSGVRICRRTMTQKLPSGDTQATLLSKATRFTVSLAVRGLLLSRWIRYRQRNLAIDVWSAKLLSANNTRNERKEAALHLGHAIP